MEGYEQGWATASTAPGWEERAITLLRSARRRGCGASPGLELRPGFARLAVLVEPAAAEPELQLFLQHSEDGSTWHDLLPVPGSGILWVEPAPLGWDPGTDAANFRPRRVMPHLRARWTAPPGTGHCFGVQLVAVYRLGQHPEPTQAARREPGPPVQAAGVTLPAEAGERGSPALPAPVGARTR